MGDEQGELPAAPGKAYLPVAEERRWVYLSRPGPADGDQPEPPLVQVKVLTMSDGSTDVSVLRGCPGTSVSMLPVHPIVHAPRRPPRSPR